MKIKLINFEISNTIEDRTLTIIGTPHWILSDVYLGKGYSFQISITIVFMHLYMEEFHLVKMQMIQ